MGNRLTGEARAARIAAIVKAYDVDGESCIDIAARLNVGRSTVEGYIRDAGKMRPRASAAEDMPKLVDRLVELVAGGMQVCPAVRQVNAEFGTSFAHSTLREVIKKRQAAAEAEVEAKVAAPAPEPKTTVTFGDLVIRKMQVRVPAPDTRNGYAMVSLPAIGILAAEARRAAA